MPQLVDEPPHLERRLRLQQLLVQVVPVARPRQLLLEGLRCHPRPLLSPSSQEEPGKLDIVQRHGAQLNAVLLLLYQVLQRLCNAHTLDEDPAYSVTGPAPRQYPIDATTWAS